MAVYARSGAGSSVVKWKVPPKASTDREAMSAVPCDTSTPARFGWSMKRWAFEPVQ